MKKGQKKIGEVKIYSANVGGGKYDQKIVPQTEKCNYNVLTEFVDGYDARMSSKLHKTQGILSGAKTGDILIWLDYRVDVINPNFVTYVKGLLDKSDFVVASHPDRKTLGEEYEYIQKNISSPYLQERYGNEDWDSEMAAYVDGFSAELVNPRFFALRFTAKTAKFMGLWWAEIEKYTVFDQSQLSYLLHKNSLDLAYSTVNWGKLGNHLQVNKLK